MIGRQSGYTNQSNGIVAIGNYAGYNNTTNIKNTYLGLQSGYNSTSGDGNTFIGNNSGYSNPSSSGAFNTAIGSEAGYSITTGSRNVLMGSTTSSNGVSNDSAGWSLSSGSDNVHIGVSAGNNATSANYNVLIGSSVATSVTTSSNNVIIGENAADSINTNGQSVIIGTNAGSSTASSAGYTAGNGLIVGYNAGSGYVGEEAFALGYQAGSNISGDFNMFMGYNSGGLPKVNTTGAYNIAIGPYTGFNLSSGTRNVIVGSGDAGGSAGKQLTIGSDNTLVGFKAGSALSQGLRNTLIGSNAGANLTTGQNNLILGYQSAYNLNSGSYNVVLGPEAGYNLNNGAYNIYNGFQTGYNNISGDNNINMGYQSGYASTGNNNNIHVGYRSGYSSLANNNLFMGYESGKNNSYGANNIFLGYQAGAGQNPNAEQIGAYNIFIGNQAGLSNDNGYSNIFLGSNTGASSISGSKNVFLGENAGSSSSTSYNIFIGNASASGKGIGYLSTGIGEKNVFVGSDAGIANTTGSKNIFLGDQAGMMNNTGVENIYIGSNAGKNANSSLANYNISIGSDAGKNNQTGTENILIGRQVAGLTTSTNYNQNIIIGSEAGQNIQQDNQIFIGTNAGKINTTGNRNIFIGLNAGQANVTSPDNVVIGSDAGTSLIGSGGIGDNVLIGSQAGQDLTTGTNNIYIGSGSGANAVTSINNVVIGANAMNDGNANNVIIIGNNAGKNNAADANIFIGSNAGVHNTTGAGNIFVGYQAGYEVITSNGNIIFGNEASSTGRIADNNIILGNQTAKNVTNKGNFANNIVMGSNAGKTSNLAISSIMIGSETVGLGTGGEVNIIMGNNTAVNLGNPNNYYANTLTQMTVSTNYVTIDIPFGTGSYYFNFGDTILIESNINDYIFQSQISAIIIDNNNNGNNGKTELILNNSPAQTIPINSVLYVINIKQNEIGTNDYSKSSSNMCIGDHSGYELTTGSKNSAIGDNAMYKNKTGKYNIVFGTESGYSLNTDNNICLGIKAGYSLDEYKDTNVVNDFTFYQSNNSITSNSQNFTVYPYGTQFEINGSSSNDSRYNVNNVTPNSIIVQGTPNITENGLPDNIYPSFFTIGSSQFAYTNYTYTGLMNFNINCNILYNNSTEASNAYNIIKYASHFTISNSQFNDDIYNIRTLNGNGIIYTSGSNIEINTTGNYLNKETSSGVTISFNNISSINNITTNFFSTNIFGNDNFNIQFSSYKGIYKAIPDFPYQKQLNYPNAAPPIIRDVNFQSNGVIVKDIIINGIDYINNIYIQGNSTNVKLVNNVYINIYNPAFDTVIFDSVNNTITNISYSNNYTSQNNLFVKISGSQYNNGYYYIISSTTVIDPLVSYYIVNIDKNFPLIDEIFTITPNSFITFTYCNFKNTNEYQDIYLSNNEYKGNIIKLKYTQNSQFGGNLDYNNFIFGSYVLEKYYNNTMALNNNLNNFNTQTNNIINITLCDSGIKVKSDDFISSNDLIFQTSNSSFNNINININPTNSTITTNIDYEFVDIVAPVIIKIEGSLYNNGFYLVTNNENPFKVLTIDGNFSMSETSNITIKTKCISSFLGLVDLTYLQFNKEYTIFGSKYNDEKIFTLYNNPSCLSNSSVYLSDSTIIVNDSYNDMLMPIVKTFGLNNGQYSVFGYFQHIEFNNITISFLNTYTITIDATSDISLQIKLNSLVNSTYISLSNTLLYGFDGLYYINSIVSLTGIYTIIINTKYERNNIVYTSPDPFYPYTSSSIQCNMLSNQFIVDNTNINNVLFTNLITGFGDNTKFLSFYKCNETINLKQNQLTFEISSYNLNISDDALSFKETCPDNTVVYSSKYLIQFGNPNPSTKISNIQRPNNRPIFYSNNYKNLTPYVSLYMRGLFTFNSGINTINIQHSFDTVDILNSYYYNNNTPYNDFRIFKPKQIISIYSGTSFNNTSFLIDTISSDFKTLHLNPSFSSIVSEIFSDTIYFNLQKILNNTPYNINQFNLPFLDDDFSLLLIKKNYYVNNTNNIYFASQLAFNTSDILKTSSSSLLCNSVLNFKDFSSLCMNNTMLTPSSNLIYNNTHISFHNYSTTGSSDISFYSSNNTITSITTNLSSFLLSEYILVSGTTNNNYLYRINDSIVPTSNAIVISSSYNLVNEINVSANINANNINTSNVSLTDLSVFSGGQVLIVSKTVNNNTNYTTNFSSNSPYSIYIDSTNVITETPQYCVIEKSMLINESSVITGVSNINFNSSQITVTDNLTDLSLLRTGQSLSITGTSNNNTNVTISNSIIPSNISITTNQSLTTEINTSASLTKQIDFTIIGTPLESLTTSGYTKLYHYEDAEGNNAMIGSFAGQFVGSLNNAIYNVAIGSRCAQVNHGSGNIFIGNESQLASTATQGATTYSNKLAIYKNNFTGVPSVPLIGGDFTSGKVGINTINPESFNLYSDISSTDTKLVVNGGAIANSFSPFTGCHLFIFDKSNVIVNNITGGNESVIQSSNVSIEDYVIPGMIMCSTGIAQISSIINTYLTLTPSTKLNEKCAFGVYAYSEKTKESSEPEYTINSLGQYVKNLAYNNNMVKLNYVAGLGEGCILVSNYSGEIYNGDYITTCPLPGYGALQSDDLMHSYTVAKCTQNIDWSNIQNNIIDIDGKSYKTVMVSCTYHAS